MLIAASLMIAGRSGLLVATETRLRPVLDWSNYTEVPTADQIAQLKAEGWEAVVLGTQDPAITVQQYAVCTANGLPVEALYAFVYWTADDYRLLANARALAAQFALKVWLDCEWTKTGYPGTGTTPPSAADLVTMIHAYQTYLAEFFLGIYTGEWWWPAYTANCLDFAAWPLWDANYTHVPSLDPFDPYGGWLRPHIRQYSSNGVDGLVVDLDVEEEPEDEMFTPLNNVASWWENRGIGKTPDGQSYLMAAKSDLGLPDAAKEVVFAVYLNSGQLRFFHGGANVEAGCVGWVQEKDYQQIRAQLAPDGSLPFICDTDCQVARVMALGWF